MFQRIIALAVGVMIGLGGLGIAEAGQWKWQDDYIFNAEASWSPMSDLKDNDGRLGATHVLAEGFIPLSGEGSALVWGLRPRVEVWALSYEGLGQRRLADGTAVDSADMPSRLWCMELAGWGSYSLGKSSYIYAELGLSLTSDMEDVSSEDMGVVALVFGGHSFSPTLEVLVGGGYNQALGRSEVYPLVGLRWAFAKDWALDILLPAHATLRWQMAPGLETGVEFATQGGYYRLTQDRPWKSAIASWEQMTLGPYAQIIIGGLVVRASVGYSFERKLEIYSDGFNRTLLDYEPDDSLILALKVYWPM